jgi:hypothetical protein
MITATELRDLMTFATEVTTLRKHIEQQAVSSALAGSTSCVITRLPVTVIAQLRIYLEAHGYTISVSDADENQSVDVVISWNGNK